MKILFLDVDGPLIPSRMYYDGIPRDKTTGIFKYDPVAVQMVLKLCRHFDLQLVYNSSHNAEGEDYMDRQAEHNGLCDYLYKDEFITKYPLGILNRIDAISEWLTRHPDVTHWAVVDDYVLEHPNAVKVDFNIGMTLDTFEALATKFVDGGIRSALIS